MVIRKSILKWLALIPLSAVIGVFAFAIFVATPSGEADACLPCACAHTLSMNCYGPFMAYADGGPDNCEIRIQKMVEGYPVIIKLTTEEIAEIPVAPTENILVDSYYEFNLYRLTSEEWQLNVGPDQENKVHVLNFRACPLTDVRESTYIAE